MVALLQGQSLVKDETARAGKAAQVALLCAIGPEFKLEGLPPFHGSNYRGSCSGAPLAVIRRTRTFSVPDEFTPR
jgi:hypothetical protein